jgi:hypothetical protein
MSPADLEELSKKSHEEEGRVFKPKLEELSARIFQEYETVKPQVEKPKMHKFIEDFEKKYFELIGLSGDDLDTEIANIADQEISSLGGDRAMTIEDLKKKHFLYMQYKQELSKSK